MRTPALAPLFLCVSYVAVCVYAISIYAGAVQAVMLIGATAGLAVLCSVAYVTLVRHHYVLEFLRMRRAGRGSSPEWQESYSRRILQFTDGERVKLIASILKNVQVAGAEANEVARGILNEAAQSDQSPQGQMRIAVGSLVERLGRPR
ncbi:hypothetical protein ACWC4D_34775 [Streptomyces sp. NPDC001288]|uniref:hypothetical protein n=1 Tax=Streptomyces sp. NPDC001297 TaxID=3364559 RepID=UPI0036A5FB2C